MPQHRESPIARTNPSGKKVWVARYTGSDGKRRSAGTFALKRDAQAAIDKAYEVPSLPTTLGSYAEVWIEKHPRSERTNRTNKHRVDRVLGLQVEGRPLADWPMADLRRRHTTEIVGHLLTNQGRSASGAVNILRALSAMLEDAITDELAVGNPFKGVKVRKSDPRVMKQPKPERTWSWEQMHQFAAKASSRRRDKSIFPAPQYEPMIRTLSDCGLRIGELFALRRANVDLRNGELRVEGSAWQGRVLGSSREKKHDRVVPIPHSTLQVLRARVPRIDSEWMFPTPNGKLWRYDNFRADLWLPTCEAAGINPTCQEFRASWVSLMRSAGIDPADLAAVAGHNVNTADAHYVRSLGRSFDQIKEMVG